MFATRQILISTLVFAAVPPAVLSAAADSVQYVGGTVKSIPVNSNGTFSFEDAKEFRFNYKGSMYKLPYDEITSTSIEQGGRAARLPCVPRYVAHRQPSQADPGHQLCGPRRRYRNPEVRVPAYRAMDAQETIAAKRSPITPAAAAAASVAATNAWWGDSVWRTKRNQATWDSQAALGAQGAAQAAQNAQNAASRTAQPGQLAPGGTK